MDRIELLFGAPELPSSLPVELYLGAQDGTGPAIPPVTVRAKGRITGLPIRVRVAVGVRVRSAARITGLPIRVRVDHDINMERPLAGTVSSRMQDARAVAAVRSSGWQEAKRVQEPVTSRWADADALCVTRSSGWGDSQRLALAIAGRDQAALAAHRVVESKFQEAVRLRHQVLDRAGDGLGRRLVHVERFQEMARLRHAVAVRDSDAQRLAMHWDQRMHDGVPMRMPWASHWQDAWPPRPGISPGRVPPEPPGEPCYVHGMPVELLAEGGEYSPALPLELVFICERHGTLPEPGNPQFVIPLLRTYMIVHTIDAVLLPSLERVPLKNITISSNDDGFGWSMSASGPVQLMEQLAPTAGVPPRIRVTVDGTEWVFVCEQPERSRKFGDRSAQVRGASVTSLLASPHMPASNWQISAPAMAQQLVLQALEFTGVGLDWQLDDWQVPAGAWSHQGAPLSVALRLAEAAGGVVRSHRTDPMLHIAPRYAHMPWAWPSASPDVLMPGQIITADTLQHVAGTRYNAVYVSGETQGGVLGHVVRSGTAGDVLAPQVTDGLITHQLVARQRGSSVLAAASITKRQAITVPLLTGGTNPGPILPGYLIEVVEPAETWRGLVRGITLNAAMPTVRQQLDVERAA